MQLPAHSLSPLVAPVSRAGAHHEAASAAPHNFPHVALGWCAYLPRPVLFASRRTQHKTYAAMRRYRRRWKIESCSLRYKNSVGWSCREPSRNALPRLLLNRTEAFVTWLVALGSARLPSPKSEPNLPNSHYPIGACLDTCNDSPRSLRRQPQVGTEGN